MKTTAVVESLSTIQPDVLFQRLPDYFKDWYYYSLTSRGVNQYGVNPILFLTTVSEKYVKMYERFLNQLKQFSQAIRVLSKGYLPITLLSPSEFDVILQKVREFVQIKNRDY